MKEVHLPLPEIGLIAVTRVALGAGIGLLAADYLSREQRHNFGWALALVGGLATIPLAADVLGRRHHAAPALSDFDEPSMASFVHS